MQTSLIMENTATADAAASNLEDSGSRPQRARRLTEKGFAYSAQQLRDRRERIWRVVNRKMRDLSDSMKNSTELEIIESELPEFNEHVAEFESVCDAYRDLLGSSELDADDELIQSLTDSIVSFKTKLYDWLNINKKPDHEGESVRSGCSSRASVKSLRTIDRMAKLAALEEQKRFSEKEAKLQQQTSQLQQQTSQLQQQAKQLEIEKELAVTRAELLVYEQFNDEDPEINIPLLRSQTDAPDLHRRPPPNMKNESSGGKFGRLRGEVSNPSSFAGESTRNRRSDLRPQFDGTCIKERERYKTSEGDVIAAGEYIDSRIIHDSERNINQADRETEINSIAGSSQPSNVDRVMESLNETMKRAQLPKLELSVFRGDSLEFQQWLVSFEKLIEINTLDPAQRLHYLMQYTAGDANTLVSGYMLCTSETGYQTAKKKLVKEYGDPYVMARAYLTRIETWKPIPPNDVAALRTFNTFLKRCKGSMPSLRHLQQLNTDLYLQRIVLKLPYGLQACWRKTVNRVEEAGGDVTFEDLVDFVDQQARIAKHPVFSAEALLEADGKNGGRRQAHVVESGKKTLLATDISAPSQQSSTFDSVDRDAELNRCIMCSCLHDLDECRSYMDLSTENRKQFLIQKRLCFACYGAISVGHTARTCRRKRTCRICDNLHPTGLHGDKLLPQPQ